MSIQSNVQALLAGMCRDDAAAAAADKRELLRAVRRAGRPGGQDDRSQILAELNQALIQDYPLTVRREILWMLSEIGGDESVGRIAESLRHQELRDDARMALERIPGSKSLAALEAELAAATDDFKANIAQSLRRRGVKVAAPPCPKLVPTRETAVKSLMIFIVALAAG